MMNAVPKANWKEMVLLFIGRRIGFKVMGDSMAPMLNSGDRVLVDPKQAIATGDIVLANHPYKQNVRMIKRVTSIDSDASYFLTGDNPAESTDSHTFGKIPSKDVLGKVVCRV